ncbi:MAG TPA: 1-deoxy-D-xylulose-5-phosphate reductoisomerase [Nitrospina sp.]|jgi:1-deoxy-D-xylulose-5-phosphate reductoisomerase|nr:1-deoxy-D-xylulose-5-phosphate reductoisomerase [Nitrospinaceae bacterium]MDP7147531.1 1-deoxy-D-xylulose-5-phosphate reductoisomerase [Nitrospinaceae bacterium]MDP7611826.1 1-deoxy-D-xylulose-5-phosphate reductoisomerase [Nitrospinaceae bacterium]MEE1550692.1 1-deoxy-D-xylulose-5-phosphate reductoisomerase [Nitrospinaceae bacterium]HAX45932.1 1-deoxy-D-xylulose-5-phosphate reductoisomerase [Nitrospina sp.]|tara:strand:+ start:4972 stop:6123 length:1152 start_codon:yes stop_codon:yes gene_type:complete
MKMISLLGSTGSIGVNALDVVRRNPDRFAVAAMTAGSNVELFAQQVKEFKPSLISVFNSSKLEELKELLKGEDVEILTGEEGTVNVATHSDISLVVSAIVGSAGLAPSMAAIKSGKDLAIANKETLVVAGELVLREAKGKVNIIPIDSEHSAILQALNGEKEERIKKIILTGSGGPFRTFTKEKMENVTVKEALNHPNWSMGAKITIDSATMMNKGLEWIEAKWLFGLDTCIEIIVHPQSIIHSMIEFVDTSIMAQLGMPDMRVPIAYALTYPDRIECDFPSLDLAEMKQLTFEEPDYEKFPCIKLAQEALETGQTMPAVLNAANEVAVQAFLDEAIPFKDIAETIRTTMHNHKCHAIDSLEDVQIADQWAREEAKKRITVAH